MLNKLKITVVLSGLAFGAAIHAENSSDVAAIHTETTSDALTRIEAETLVLKARERQLEVQASIVQKQSEIAAKQNATNMTMQPQVIGDPVVRSIEGVGATLYASLQMNDGSVVDVQSGDVLPNGMKIVSIRAREVIALSKTNLQIHLANYAPQPSGFNPAFPNAGLMMPQFRGAMR